MNANKALWEKGDFTRIAASMRASGEAFAANLIEAGAARAREACLWNCRFEEGDASDLKPVVEHPILVRAARLAAKSQPLKERLSGIEVATWQDRRHTRTHRNLSAIILGDLA